MGQLIYSNYKSFECCLSASPPDLTVSHFSEQFQSSKSVQTNQTQLDNHFPLAVIFTSPLRRCRQKGRSRGGREGELGGKSLSLLSPFSPLPSNTPLSKRCPLFSNAMNSSTERNLQSTPSVSPSLGVLVVPAKGREEKKDEIDHHIYLLLHLRLFFFYLNLFLASKQNTS